MRRARKRDERRRRGSSPRLLLGIAVGGVGNRRGANVAHVEKLASNIFANVTIDGNRRERCTALRYSRLMVLGDVHARVAEYRADVTDYTGDVGVREDDERATRGHVHLEV